MCCPACRTAGAQLAALQAGFAEVEDIPAPEGFTQGVMDRIRAEEPKKVIPLFKRPQVRALAGLAACLVVAVGLYGMSQRKNQEKTMLMARSFQQDALWEEPAASAESGDASACESLDGDSPMVNAAPEPTDAPQIAGYAAVPSPAQADAADVSIGTAGMAPEAFTSGEEAGVEKVVPNLPADGYGGDWACAEITLTLDRMPEGGWELIPPETPVSPYGVYVTAELLEQIRQLAEEQGIEATVTTGTEGAERYLIAISDETE